MFGVDRREAHSNRVYVAGGSVVGDGVAIGVRKSK
jgi:hypothetical protein